MTGAQRLAELMQSPFTYTEVGASARMPLPAGYHHLRERTLVGQGSEVLEVAATALMAFEMHRVAGLRVRASADRAAVGVVVISTLGIGRVGIQAPCRVVSVIDVDSRRGFAYGTLAGHPESGEESFLLELLPSGDVWLTVIAFSRPARWYVRLGGPVTRVFQRRFARRCGRVLRDLAARST